MDNCATMPLQAAQTAPYPPIFYRLAIFGAFGIAGFAWFQLFHQLHIEWSANEQYGYGWFVPLLAAGLFYRRWMGRPEVNIQRSEDRSSRFVPLGVALLFCFILPLRLVENANAGWRSIQWLHALTLTALTFLLLLRIGGWAWLRHFWFPIFFLLVAVPWPTYIEGFIVKRLMTFVAALTVEVVSLFDIPAMRQGNLLAISSGTVSVDGACSGVRSLQTSLMAALLLGEVYRLGIKSRLALVPLGVLLALAANIGRTSFLTWSAARQGFEKMETWHGPAGIAVVFVVLGGIWMAALLLKRFQTLSANPSPVPALGPLTSEFRPPTTDLGLPTSDLRPLTSARPPTPPLPTWALVAVFSWLIFTEAFTAFWFHLGDKRSVTNHEWTINWPTNAPGFKDIPLRPIESDMLRYDTARNTSWLDESRNTWTFIALHWGPKNKHSFVGRGHTPDQCFVGAGWCLKNEPEPIRLNVNGIDLPFRRYTFEVDGKTAHTFLALWDERSPGGRQELPLHYGIKSRLKAAWEGKRHQGLKKLEIAIIGPATSEEAVQVLERGLKDLIIVEKGPPQTLTSARSGLRPPTSDL